jgi:glycosyltransferase 2 family protein
MTHSFAQFRTSSRKWLPLLMWGGVAVLVGVGLAGAVDGAEVWGALQSANGSWLVAAACTLVATQLLKAVRWRTLLYQAGIFPGWAELIKVQLIGQGLNTFLPIRIGEVARVQWLYRYDRAVVLSSVAIEKSADLLCFGVMGVALVIGATLPPFLNDRFMGFALTTAVAIAMVTGILLIGSESRLTRLVHRFTLLRPMFAPYIRFRNGWRQVTRPRDGLVLVLLSGAVWGMAILTNLCLLAAFDMPPTWVIGTVLLVVLQIGITVVTLPATIGIFEYLCVITLGWFGIPESVAFSIGIVLHLLVLIPSVVGIWFARPTTLNDSRRQQEQ